MTQRSVFFIAAVLAAACADCSSGNSKDKSSEQGTGDGGTAVTRAAVNAAAKQTLPEVPHKVFDTAEQAMAKVLASSPRVLGVGEYHERRDAPKVRSTIKRFNGPMAELLKGRASDFILETWVEDGRCGKKQARVDKDVQATIRRPAHTENQLLALLNKVKELGVRPHILAFKCDDYAAVLDDKKQVDYDKYLDLVTKKLGGTTSRVLAFRDKQAAEKKAVKKMIVVYGGALHNDLYPNEGVEMWSYAAKVARAAGGSYVEVDLYVPEYIHGNKLLKTQSWYPLYEQLASQDKVILIERAKDSFILILRKELR